jgi:hypothetical protein
MIKYSYHYSHDQEEETIYTRHLVHPQSGEVMCHWPMKIPRQKKPKGKSIKCQLCYDIKKQLETSI